MRNNQAARRQETTRRILVISIFILLLAIIGLMIRMISVKSCSNPGKTGFLPTESPVASTPTPEPTAPIVSASPIPSQTPIEITATPEPTVAPTPEATPEQNQYGVPRLVTEGSMSDVLARLEQFKTLPSSETLILLDVGHGGFDPGTAGVNTGVTEAELNLQVSRLVAQKLAEKGYFVFMTRMGEYACADTKKDDMNLRTRIMRLDIFDCSISIHMNAAADSAAHGIRMYHYKTASAGAKYALDEQLAKSILQSVCAMTDETRSITDTGNFMTTREPKAPAALVECGFISNPDDEKKLSDPSYQAVFAQAVANGVENFLKGLN